MDLKSCLVIEKKNGTPHKEIADRAGISKTYLYDIASGRKLPRLKVARRINAACAGKVPYEDLIKFYEQHQNNTPN